MIVKAAIGFLLLMLFIVPTLAQPEINQNNVATGSDNLSANQDMSCATWNGYCYRISTGEKLPKLLHGPCYPVINIPNSCVSDPYEEFICDAYLPESCPWDEHKGPTCRFIFLPGYHCDVKSSNSGAAPVQNLTADCEANPKCHWVNGECLCAMTNPEQIECEKDPNCAWRDGRCICVMPEPEEIMPEPVPNPTEPMPGPVPNPTPNG